MVITGKPGGGKSALLSQAVGKHVASEEWEVICHFVGINARSTQLAYVMERLVQQLAELVPCSLSETEQVLRQPFVKQMECEAPLPPAHAACSPRHMV